MRWAYGFLLLLNLAAPAAAADVGPEDLGPLRGSQVVGPATFTRWAGFYAGGDASINNANVDFTNATQPLIAQALQNTVVEQTFSPSQLTQIGRGAGTALGGGAFLGYNTQWQDLVVGVEANYTHTNVNATAASSQVIARMFSPPVGNVSAIAISDAKGQARLTDYGEARFRAGYIVGNLLPYGFVGFVAGMGSYNASTHVDLTCASPPPAGECVGYPLTPSSGQNNALFWGFSVGGGLDWALTQNFFLRGEFEFVQFAPVASINIPVVSGKLGAGFKF